MRISEGTLRRIINEEIGVYRRDLNDGQFGYIVHALMASPDETVSNDLYDPRQGRLILKKGESISDISDTAAYYLHRDYNIDLSRSGRIRRKKDPGIKISPPTEDVRSRSGPSSVDAVSSSLLGYVRSGSRPLRSDIKDIKADIRRDQIVVYLRDPKDRIATDQEIACALRYLLDQKVQASGKFIINPCGFGQEQSETLIVIVKL